jgi:hypothetical protein
LALPLVPPNFYQKNSAGECRTYNPALSYSGFTYAVCVAYGQRLRGDLYPKALNNKAKTNLSACRKLMHIGGIRLAITSSPRHFVETL